VLSQIEGHRIGYGRLLEFDTKHVIVRPLFDRQVKELNSDSYFWGCPRTLKRTRLETIVAESFDRGINSQPRVAKGMDSDAVNHGGRELVLKGVRQFSDRPGR